MAKLMAEFSPSAKVRDYPAYEADVIAFVGRYLGKALGEVQVSTVALDMMNILRTAPRAREPGLHDVQRRDRGHRGHRQAARSRRST
jgi:hypothetical protein